MRVHQHASGAIGKNQAKQCIGRSKGGLTTKIHVAADALGLPLHLALTVGQRQESVIVPYLLVKSKDGYAIMDKGYDSTAIREAVVRQNMEAVIPGRSNRKEEIVYDKDLYKGRNLVENLFCRMKNYRRIATRYEKLAYMYANMIILSFILIWLRF